MADRYWVGGTDTWNSTAGTKWAATSGGAGGEAVPTTSDDVYFDANSTGTCTISGNRSCRNLNETGHAGVLSHSGSNNLTVAGSLTLTSAYVATNSTSGILFTATSTGQTITTAGNPMGDLTFQGVGGGWTLQDSLNGISFSSCDLNLISGSLDLNGQSVDSFKFDISGSSARSLTMGSSAITACYAWNATTTTNLTFNSGTSSLEIFDSSSTFGGGGLTYYSVQISFGLGDPSFTITGANTYTNLTLVSWTPTGNIALGANQTVTGTFLPTVNDSASNDPDRLTILSSVRGTQRTITAATMSGSVEYTSFRDIVGAGAADWDFSGIAGGCGDLGNNSGITFSTPITAYYYQNTGNLYDKTKWFLASGGTGGAARIPLPQDTARFDASSCNAGSQTITLNYQWLPTLDFTGSDNNEAVSFGVYGNPDIHGSFTLASGMTISGGASSFTFSGYGKTPTFTTNGVSITKTVGFRSELASAIISGNYSSTGSLSSISCALTTTGTVSCAGLAVGAGGNFTPGGNVTLAGTLTTSGYINSSGYTFSGVTTATFSSGSVIDLLGLTASSTVTFTSGTLTIGASGVSCSAFSSSNSNTRTLNMGSGTWDITGTGTCWTCATTTGLTINKDTSTIRLSNTSATTKTFDGGSGKVYNDLYIDGAASNGTVTINKANTYNKITIEPYASIIWKKSLTHTFSELLCLGASGQVITFATDTAGTQATLSCPTGKVINGDYLNIRDSVATGGALFYAGDNSTNTSNNTGWTFTAQPDLDNVVPLQSYLLNELTPNVGGIQTPLHAYSFTEYAPEISTGAFLVTPLQNYTLNNYVPTVISGGGVEVPLKEFTLNEYSPTIMLVDVPLSTLDIEFHTMSIASGASADAPLTEFGFDGYTPLVSISANVFAPLKTFDIQFYSTDQLVTVPRRSFLITSGIEVASGSQSSIPLETFAFTSYIPSFVGEQPVHNVPITDFAEISFLSYTPEIASGKNIFVPVTAFEITSGISYYSIQLVTCTGEPAPIQHIEDSKKLTADAYIDLFEIVLAGGGTKLYLKMNQSVDWQGNTYEGTGIKIEGVGTYSDDEVSRPKLTIFNPENVFSYLVDQGLLENAKVVRIRVLKEHIDDDLPIYRRQQWFVKRVASVRRGFIGLELRDMLDGQNFLTPGRMFIPPEFPMVSLQ